MTRQTCETCRWWNRHSGLATGDCQKRPPNSITSKWPATYAEDFCGEWQDGRFTPEQAERRELVRRFAVAIVAGDNRAFSCEPTFVWQLAEQYVDAEEQT